MSFLISLILMFAAMDADRYVMVNGNYEKAVVVSDQIIFTDVRIMERLQDESNGMFEGYPVCFLRSNKMFGLKAYASTRKLTVSKDVPPTLKVMYQRLLDWAKPQRGITRILIGKGCINDV